MQQQQKKRSLNNFSNSGFLWKFGVWGDDIMPHRRPSPAPGTVPDHICKDSKWDHNPDFRRRITQALGSTDPKDRFHIIPRGPKNTHNRSREYRNPGFERYGRKNKNGNFGCQNQEGFQQASRLHSDCRMDLCGILGFSKEI